MGGGGGRLTDDGQSPSQYRGLWGRAPPGKFWTLHLPRSILVHSDSILAQKYL